MKGDIVKGLDKRNDAAADMLPVWDKCEDVFGGQTEIHKKGVKYLPRLESQTDAEYDAYKKRATFYGAMGRTVNAFTGMVMRTPPVIDNQTPLLDDVTMHRCNINDFAGELLEQMLVCSFGGVLVEHTPQVAGVATLAQAQALNARPYLAMFECDDIINWRYNGPKLVQVIVEEDEEIVKSEFVSECRDTWRVLDIDSAGQYRQRRFARSEKVSDEFIQIDDDIYPLLNGAPLREIPFYFFGSAEKLPILIDLVDLNISHYHSTADVENGAHRTGTPQPWVAGVQLDMDDTLRVGSSEAWVFPDPDASANYLEYTGAGLSALEKRIEIKEKQMAALGAKMLSDTVVAETATGATLRSGGEFSVLAKIAGDLSKVLSQACSFMYAWAGLPSVLIQLNTDFIPARMTPQELQALLMSWQSGAISYPTLFRNMQQGEIMAASSTVEEEQALISEYAPPAPTQPKPTAAL